MTEPAIHVRWPASRFYWAVLDGSALPRTLGIPARPLGFLLEAQIPQPIEEVHAVFAALPGRRYVACALPKDVLASETPETAITLAPDALPGFVPAEVDPAALNLLTGPFTPKVLERGRRRWILQCAALLLAAIGFLLVGFERRASALDARQMEIARSSAGIVEERLGYAAVASRLPLDLRLQAELRALRQTRNASVPNATTADAAATLARLLALWPESLHSETESVQISGESVSLRATLPTNEDAQTLASALSRLPGFDLSIPSVHAASDAIRAELAWTREKSGHR